MISPPESPYHCYFHLEYNFECEACKSAMLANGKDSRWQQDTRTKSESQHSDSLGILIRTKRAVELTIALHSQLRLLYSELLISGQKNIGVTAEDSAALQSLSVTTANLQTVIEALPTIVRIAETNQKTQDTSTSTVKQ